MRYSNVILVNPPDPSGYRSNKDSMGGFGQLFPRAAAPFPPLDMPYLAGALEGAGIPVQVIEASARDLDVQATIGALRIAGAAAGTLVCLRTALPTVDTDLATCAAIRAAMPEVALAIYGPVVGSMLVRIQQDPTIDYAVIGEPDQTVVLLAGDTPLAEIGGLLYRDGAAWQRTAERRGERDLDKLPFPKWELMPTERYIIPKSAAAGAMRSLPMLTSRGCPFGCNYCPYPVGQGLQWRYRSAGNVVDEMQHLVRDFGVEYIIFRDPLFSANKKRVAAICEEIVKRGVKVKWRCETRVDCLDEPTIKLMSEAGCVGVNFGVESSDPQIQKNVERKPITEATFIETIGLFKKYGITTFAFFVIGLPGDTVKTILSTIRFAIDLNATWTQFTVATPFIGTKLYDWAVVNGKVEAGQYAIISSHEGSMGNENLTPAQIHRLHRFAQILQRNFMNRRGVLKNEFRRTPGYRAAKHLADATARTAARGLFAAGAQFFRQTVRTPGAWSGATPLEAAGSAGATG